MGDPVEALREALVAGDRRALARALSRVEGGGPEADALLRALPPGGRTHRIGITGPPGAGKSTLVSALATAWRDQDATVGILAVDPSSPFTGGALLGDRVRMGAHHGDPAVFVRSLASRGALGGLAPRTHEAADVLEAAGFDPVLIETVGVGQGEVAICGMADTTVVVLAPGAGDEIQGMKAGLLEAADVLVVNQADRPEAEALHAALEAAIELRAPGRPRPPLLRTTALTGEGVDSLRAWLDGRGAARDDGAGIEARRRARIRARLRDRVDARRSAAFWGARGAALDAQVASVLSGQRTLGAAADALVSESDSSTPESA